MKLATILASIAVVYCQNSFPVTTHADSSKAPLNAPIGKCTPMVNLSPIESIDWFGRGWAFFIFYSDGGCQNNIGGGPCNQNFNNLKAGSYRLYNLRGPTLVSFYEAPQYYFDDDLYSAPQYY